MGRLLAGRSWCDLHQEMTDDGVWGDYWRLRGSSRSTCTSAMSRSRSTPLRTATVRRFDRSKMFMAAITYDEMRPGCYEPKARVDDLAAAGVDGSLAFPTFPALLRSDVPGRQRPRARPGVRAGVQRLDDRRVVRRLRRPPHPAVPDPAVGRRSRGGRGRVATPPAGARAICFSEIPTHLGLPSIHTGYWDPLFAVVRGDAHHAVHAHRLVVEDARRLAGRAAVDRHHAVVQQLDGIARRLPVLGRARPVPRAEARLLGRPDRLDPLRARACRQRVAVPLELDARRPEDPRAALDLLPGPCVRLLHERRPRPGLHRRGGRGQRLLRDRLPAHGYDVAVRARGDRTDDRRSHRPAALQGAARQRDPDARPRSRAEAAFEISRSGRAGRTARSRRP